MPANSTLTTSQPHALASALLLVASGCGGHSHGPAHVTYLSLTPTTGFPGSPTDVLVVSGGRRLKRLARLVPHTLPAPAGTARKGLRICFPMDLTIGLSNGDRLDYPACERPRSLLRLVRALCPLLHKRGLCAYYRNEL